MIDSFVAGFKSAFTWHMVGQTVGQLVIVACIVVLGIIVVAMLE